MENFVFFFSFFKLLYWEVYHARNRYIFKKKKKGVQDNEYFSHWDTCTQVKSNYHLAENIFQAPFRMLGRPPKYTY